MHCVLQSWPQHELVRIRASCLAQALVWSSHVDKFRFYPHLPNADDGEPRSLLSYDDIIGALISLTVLIPNVVRTEDERNVVTAQAPGGCVWAKNTTVTKVGTTRSSRV
jgi:hypothetical protein